MLRFVVIAYTDETGPVSVNREEPVKSKGAAPRPKPLSLSLLMYSFDGAAARIIHQYTDLCVCKIINGPLLTLLLPTEALFLSWNKEVSS